MTGYMARRAICSPPSPSGRSPPSLLSSSYLPCTMISPLFYIPSTHATTRLHCSNGLVIARPIPFLRLCFWFPSPRALPDASCWHSPFLENRLVPRRCCWELMLELFFKFPGRHRRGPRWPLNENFRNQAVALRAWDGAEVLWQENEKHQLQM